MANLFVSSILVTTSPRLILSHNSSQRQGNKYIQHEI